MSIGPCVSEADAGNQSSVKTARFDGTSEMLMQKELFLKTKHFFFKRSKHQSLDANPAQG